MLTGLRMRHFKSWKDSGDIRLAARPQGFTGQR